MFAGFSIYADINALQTKLAGFQWWAFAAALGLALINYAVRFVRWHLYLRISDIAVPLRISALTFLSGFALSVTPGKIGELVKSYLLRTTCNVSVARSAPIVVAERFTDLIALLILSLIGVAAYGVAQSMVLAGAAVVAVPLVFVSWPRCARAAIRAMTIGPLQRFRDRLLVMYDGLAGLLRPKHLSWASALSVIAWLAECVGFALIVMAFPGAEVPVGLAVLIYATTTVAGALSFLPGGLLVTEASMTGFLHYYGLDTATAVAATILTRLATLWFAVLIGLVALGLFRHFAPATKAALSDPPAPSAR